jgi:hypothetical protein
MNLSLSSIVTLVYLKGKFTNVMAKNSLQSINIKKLALREESLKTSEKGLWFTTIFKIVLLSEKVS